MTKTPTRPKDRDFLPGPAANHRGRHAVTDPFALRHLPATAGVALVWVASWLVLIVWVLAVLIP